MDFSLAIMDTAQYNPICESLIVGQPPAPILLRGKYNQLNGM